MTTTTRLITDYVERMLDDLLPRWRQSPRMTQLAEALGAGLQDIENVTYQSIVERYLSTAEGVQLDTYADLFAARRDGRSDGDLRVFLQAKILAIRGGSTPSAIAQIAALLFFSGQPFGVRYIHNQPAAYQLQVTPFEEGADLHTHSNAVSTSAEAATSTGWPASGASIGISTIDPFHGTRSYLVTAIAATQAFVLYQPVTVAGRTYRISFYAKRGSVGVDQRIASWFGVAVSPNVRIQAGTDWVLYTFDVVATGALIQAKIYANFDAGAIGDQVSVDAFEVHELLVSAVSADIISEALKILLLATPAGVGISMITQSSPKGSFKFGDGTPDVTNDGFGNAGFSKLLVSS